MTRIRCSTWPPQLVVPLVLAAAACEPARDGWLEPEGWLDADPSVVRIVGAETATVALRAQPPVRLEAALSAPGVRVFGPGGTPDAWTVGPEPVIARFSLSPEVEGHVEGEWRLRSPAMARDLVVPIRATTHLGPRLRPVGPDPMDAGAVPLEGLIRWPVRNEGGRSARLRVVAVGGPAQLRGQPTRAVAALTATTVEVRLALEGPGPFEVWARVESGTTSFDLAAMGEGVAPALRPRPALLDFSALVVGDEASRELTLENSGGGSLRVDAIRLSPGAEAAFRWAWLDAHVPPSGPWWVGARPRRARVTFAPEAPGPYARELRIEHAAGLTVVPLRGSARSCEAACPVPRGHPTCANGRCFIERCDPGYFDANASIDDGCECADLEDPGATCSTALALGRIEEQSAPRIVRGRIPVASDVDLVRFHADDGFHLFRESFDVHVELQSDATGVELCVFRRPTDEPRPECVLSEPRCPKDRRVRFRGSYGREDAADFVVRIRASDESPAACTPYRLIIRNG